MFYELLFLNRAHRIAERFPFVAPNDAEAQEVAEDLDQGAERELWCGPRVVKRWLADERQRATDTD
jgi:hypothetical protein